MHGGVKWYPEENLMFVKELQELLHLKLSR